MKECPNASFTAYSKSEGRIYCSRTGGTCVINHMTIGITDAVTNPPLDHKGELKWQPLTLEQEASLFIKANCDQNRSEERIRRRS